MVKARGVPIFPFTLSTNIYSLISPNLGLDIIVLLEAPGGFPNLSRIVSAPTTTRWLARRLLQKLSLRTHTSECCGKPVGFPREVKKREFATLTCFICVPNGLSSIREDMW